MIIPSRFFPRPITITASSIITRCAAHAVIDILILITIVIGAANNITIIVVVGGVMSRERPPGTLVRVHK